MKNTEKQFDAVLEQALLLHERGLHVPEIIERFPEHEARLREAFAVLPLIKEAGGAVRPSEYLLHRILASLDVPASALEEEPHSWERVRRAVPFWLRARWRVSLPIALVGAIAALLAVLERAEAPAPLPGAEDRRVAEKSALPSSSPEVAREGPAVTMFSAPPASAPAPVSAPLAATTPPESSSPDFAAIFAEENAVIAAEEANAALAQSGPGFNDIGNSYDETAV